MTQAAQEETDIRRKARGLYYQGWRVARIAEEVGVKPVTVHSWKRREAWDDAKPVERVEATIEARMIQLVVKDQKEGKDFKEIDLLGRQMERLARVGKYSETGKESDLNPNVLNGNLVKKKPPRKNVIEDVQAAEILRLFEADMFAYQRKWEEASSLHRIVNLLKSRQIGATRHFARSALCDAIRTGRNQIFLSASKAQAHVFKQYILELAGHADVALSGDPIVLDGGATLYFLGTSSRTAQSYHGNLYFDEYFWVYDFLNLRKVASGMAMHKKWKQVYFSTPSAFTHPAYKFWTGQMANRGRPKKEHIHINTSHEALKAGRLCEDGHWRQIVTVEDAVAAGCDLFDIEQLRSENSPEEFDNLLMCQFIDDALSVFPLSMLESCRVDSWEAWEDFRPFAARPFGNRGVWLGYDPSLSGDKAALVVLAPPITPGGLFRVLERQQFQGADFSAQAEYIRKMTLRYHVTYIGIDTTGMGQGVYQIVKQFFPTVQSFSYSPEIKSRLVLKALDVMRQHRLQFDAGDTALAASFMAIKKTLTKSGAQVTYKASRADDIGHADLAWATMHALANEPLAGAPVGGRSVMEIY